MAALHKVFSSPRAIEAHLVRAALESAGIDVVLYGGDLVPGAFGVDARAEVWVPEDAVADAHEVMGTALRRDQTGALSLVQAPAESGRLAVSASQGGEVTVAEPTRCPGCSAPWEPGFEVCWSCGEALSPSRS